MPLLFIFEYLVLKVSLLDGEIHDLRKGTIEPLIVEAMISWHLKMEEGHLMAFLGKLEGGSCMSIIWDLTFSLHQPLICLWDP